MHRVQIRPGVPPYQKDEQLWVFSYRTQRVDHYIGHSSRRVEKTGTGGLLNLKFWQKNIFSRLVGNREDIMGLYES